MRGKTISSNGTDRSPPSQTIALTSRSDRVDGPHPHGSGSATEFQSGDRVWCPAGRTEDGGGSPKRSSRKLSRRGKFRSRKRSGCSLADQSRSGNRPVDGANLPVRPETILWFHRDGNLSLSPPGRRNSFTKQLRQVVCRRTAIETIFFGRGTFCPSASGKDGSGESRSEKVRGEGRRRHREAPTYARRVEDSIQNLYVRGCPRGYPHSRAARPNYGLAGRGNRSRTVQDLDDRGRVLPDRVEWGDRFTPKRPNPVERSRSPGDPAPPRLASADKSSPAPCFSPGGRRAAWRDWVAESTRRYCRRAGLPVVCAHSLRGVAATLSTQAGGGGRGGRAAFGARVGGMTRRAYIQPGTIRRTELGRVAEGWGRWVGPSGPKLVPSGPGPQKSKTPSVVYRRVLRGTDEGSNSLPLECHSSALPVELAAPTTCEAM